MGYRHLQECSLTGGISSIYWGGSVESLVVLPLCAAQSCETDGTQPLARGFGPAAGGLKMADIPPNNDSTSGGDFARAGGEDQQQSAVPPPPPRDK